MGVLVAVPVGVSVEVGGFARVGVEATVFVGMGVGVVVSGGVGIFVAVGVIDDVDVGNCVFTGVGVFVAAGVGVGSEMTTITHFVFAGWEPSLTVRSRIYVPARVGVKAINAVDVLDSWLLLVLGPNETFQE